MEIKTEITIVLPQGLVAVLGITEETLFETYFDGSRIRVRVLDAENYEDDFKSISAQIEQLSKRITAIWESESEDGDLQARLKEIQDIIDKRRENKDTYDDSIVRQRVECIKAYHDGRLQIILGGRYELEEYLESKLE